MFLFMEQAILSGMALYLGDQSDTTATTMRQVSAKTRLLSSARRMEGARDPASRTGPGEGRDKVLTSVASCLR